ncbi:MAG: pectin esterase, partial [Duncaniella sp.]|nr:pectin esterase [Duncaniella sp.]
AIYIRCNLGKHIVPKGWNNWGKTSNEQTVNYAEYQSIGEGANPSARTGYSRQLTDITPYSIQSVLSGNDNWNPTDN